MKWYDTADDAKRRNAANEEWHRVNRDKPPPEVEPFAEGMVYRTADGSPYGRWRVARESPESTMWSVFDVRRGHPKQPIAVRVVGGLSSPQAAIMVAEMVAKSRSVRMTLAVRRALGDTAIGVVSAVRSVVAEWRLP